MNLQGPGYPFPQGGIDMFDKVGNSGMLQRVVVQVCLLLLLASILTACGVGAPPKISLPKVTITATDSSFSMPESIHTGLIDITVVNAGVQKHQAQLDRLNAGVTLTQLQAAMKKSPDAFSSLVIPAGGIALIEPTQSREIVVDLSAGQYVLFDDLGPANNSNFAKGMLKSFMVTGPSNEAQVSLPKADVEATLKDFGFGLVLPEKLTSDLLTYKVTNQGAQPHEMILFKLSPGKIWQDVMAYLQSLSGSPPGELIGGLGAIAPGKTAWIKMKLAPGNYLILCFLPDKASGLPHVQLGMVCSFIVQ